jgi:hypothetical protein
MHTQLYKVIMIRVISGLDTWLSPVSCVNVGLLNVQASLGYISISLYTFAVSISFSQNAVCFFVFGPPFSFSSKTNEKFSFYSQPYSRVPGFSLGERGLLCWVWRELDTACKPPSPDTSIVLD